MNNLDELVLKQIQDILVGFTPVMRFFSFLGDGESYIIIMILLLWCFDYKSVFKFAIYVVLTTAATEMIKLFIQLPRPSQIHEGIKYINDYGMPSGHSSTAFVFFGYLNHLFKSKFLLVVSSLVIFLIGVSRIALDKHYPSQVLIGFLLGSLLLILFLKNKNEFYKKTSLFISANIIVLAISSFIVVQNNNQGMVNLKNLYQLSGLISGISLGGYLLKDLNISVKSSLKNQLLKVFVFIISLCIFISFKWLINVVIIEHKVIFLGVNLLLYWFFAIWLAYLGPKIFLKYGLMVRSTK